MMLVVFDSQTYLIGFLILEEKKYWFATSFFRIVIVVNLSAVVLLKLINNSCGKTSLLLVNEWQRDITIAHQPEWTIRNVIGLF